MGSWSSHVLSFISFCFEISVRTRWVLSETVIYYRLFTSIFHIYANVYLHFSFPILVHVQRKLVLLHSLAFISLLLSSISTRSTAVLECGRLVWVHSIITPPCERYRPTSHNSQNLNHLPSLLLAFPVTSSWCLSVVNWSKCIPQTPVNIFPTWSMIICSE